MVSINEVYPDYSNPSEEVAVVVDEVTGGVLVADGRGRGVD